MLTDDSPVSPLFFILTKNRGRGVPPDWASFYPVTYAATTTSCRDRKNPSNAYTPALLYFCTPAASRITVAARKRIAQRLYLILLYPVLRCEVRP